MIYGTLYMIYGTMHKKLCKSSRIASPWFASMVTPLASHFSPQPGEQCFVKNGFMVEYMDA